MAEPGKGEEYLKNNDVQCEVCFKKFKSKALLKQHMQIHQRKHQCKYCGKLFSFGSNLKRHENATHKQGDQTKQIFFCNICNKSFTRKAHISRHTAAVHRNNLTQSSNSFSCRHCNREFSSYRNLVEHVEHSHPLNQEGGRQEASSKRLYDDDDVTKTITNKGNPSDKVLIGSQSKPQETNEETNEDLRHDDESALRNRVENRNIYPRHNQRYDILSFFASATDEIRNYLKSRVRQLGGIKWNMCVQIEMQRDDGDEMTISTPYFRSRTYRFLPDEDLQEHDLNEAFQKMFAALEKYQREGSNWFVKKIIKLEIHTVLYRPISGSTYVPLPETLLRSQSILNIRNNDYKCFLYCILASLYPQEKFPDYQESYERYENELVMTGMSYPVSIADISKFERQNVSISVNVFGFEDGTILPLRVTSHSSRIHHVNLLWLTSVDTSHYCLITDLNRFLSRTKKHTRKTYFCPYCLHGFIRDDLLENHKEYCSMHGPQKVILPEDGATLKFKEYEKTLKVPFVIYADFETLNVKLQTCMPNPEYASTTPTTKLEVCGYAYKVVSEDSRYTKPTVVYRGPQAAKRLIECLVEEQRQIQEILSHIEPMPEHEGYIDNAKYCCLCKKQFSLYDRTYKKIVVHHNHLNGSIIGPSCQLCNLQCKQAKFTCVMFHNLRNFDAHILCESLGEFKDFKLNCICQTSERYVSFSLGNLRFLDSFQFLPSSLETLVNNLKLDGIDAFPHLLSEFEERNQVKLLVRKGIYPYDYVDSFHRFEDKELPPQHEFYSSLKKEGISVEEYAHAQKVFEEFNLSSLGDYHDLYVKTDVLLLADVFESFRKVCLGHYELDPCHFYTSPGLSWSSLLKMTGIELELLTDIDQILMIEAGTRGGISQISNRFQKANNPYLEDYDQSEKNSYLTYLDANNLYGWAMVQPLPVRDFKFVDNVEEFDVMTIKDNSQTGYILEVSLQYPAELHDLHNCLPLAPEQKTITNEQLSPHAQHLLRKLHGLNDEDPLPSSGRVKKLLATLEDKSHYILHYRNLQLYLKLGMKLKKIHRILQFRQEPWMKPYIDFNTEMRKRARSPFEATFFKILNVSVYGKTLQNERKYKNIELVHLEERLRKLSAKSTYKTTTIFNEDLVAVELLRSKVKLSKPSYCGMCILDLSKCLMYDFWYGYIKRRYGEKAQLQMTDTDSLLFHCETDDIYRDMLHSIDLFDTSDYPIDHFLYSEQNKKTLGKMKDEMNGKPIAEFVGLRSKLYSFKCNNKEEKRAKGVSKVVVKKDLRHEHYKSTLFNETRKVSLMTSLRSHKHVLFCENINKTGLSAFDDKRFLLNPINSYAYGHYKINQSGEYMSDCSEQMIEGASKQVCDNLNEVPMEVSLEDNSPYKNVGIVHIQDEYLIFDDRIFTPNEDQCFFLNDYKITPYENPKNL